ncbi:MAG: sigma factor-like helix-turn-helix DNA-binding protein [Candidatus Latescibacteria bacterium]|jgi:predicted transcriptional regulator|nr:sigma factor-like helix-turn-helix DNA-binding protein [Candidatus Latescibacterota bacterium]
MPTVLKFVDEALTPRQRKIVRLYFLERMAEHEIAERLGISVPGVSQHLFGKSRGGKRVGGAIPGLRRKLERMHSEEPGISGHRKGSAYRDE